MSVDILMATYNGGKYLRNQLFSLQQQTYSDWLLWVRDDGSTDNTLAILEQFTKSDGRIRIVDEGSGKGLGPGKNFLGLTQYATADYVIFCDQDDIWFEKKIEILVDYADQNFCKESPCLVTCDGYGYSDEEGVIVSDRVWLWYAKNLKEFLFFNSGYQGCNILFNAKLNDIAKIYKADYFYMHDDVVSLIAHVFGEVHFLNKRLMLYRQHRNNVTGNITVSFLSRVYLFFRTQAFVLSGKHFEERKSFFLAYNLSMKKEYKYLFLEYLRFSKASFFKRIFILVRNDFSLGGNRIPLYLKSIIRRPLE